MDIWSERKISIADLEIALDHEMACRCVACLRFRLAFGPESEEDPPEEGKDGRRDDA